MASRYIYIGLCSRNQAESCHVRPYLKVTIKNKVVQIGQAGLKCFNLPFKFQERVVSPRGPRQPVAPRGLSGLRLVAAHRDGRPPGEHSSGEGVGGSQEAEQRNAATPGAS